jgi:hypothetical protein
MTMRLLVALAGLALVSGCAGPSDEPRLAKLADGAYELAVPQNFGTTAAPGAAQFFNESVPRIRAGQICPNGYQMNDLGTRKRPEYADPEKVWRIECK